MVNFRDLLNWTVKKYAEIKSFRNNKMLRQFVKIKEYREYNPHQIVLGWDRFEDKEFAISTNKSKIIIAIGPKGTGKTTIQSTIVDRAYFTGMKVLNVDIKGEYIYKFMPLQEKWAREPFLLRGENPIGIDIISLYFRFLQKMTSYRMENAKYERILSFPFNKISWIDLKNMLYTTSENVMSFLDVLATRGAVFETFLEFVDYVDSVDYIPEISKKVLVSKVKLLFEQGAFEEKVMSEVNIIDLLNDNKMVNINLRGAMRFWDIATSSILSNYLSSIIIQIYNAKQMGLISVKDRLLIAIDELTVFAPRDKNTSVKEALLKLLRMGRSEGISIFVGGQDWSYIPEDFLKQADIVLFSYKTSVDDLVSFIKIYFSSFITENVGNERELRSEIISLLASVEAPKKDGRRDWIVFNTEKREWNVITPILPLSYLYEEKGE